MARLRNASGANAATPSRQPEGGGDVATAREEQRERRRATRRAVEAYAVVFNFLHFNFLRLVDFQLWKDVYVKGECVCVCEGATRGRASAVLGARGLPLGVAVAQPPVIEGSRRKAA